MLVVQCTVEYGSSKRLSCIMGSKYSLKMLCALGVTASPYIKVYALDWCGCDCKVKQSSIRLPQLCGHLSHANRIVLVLQR